MTRSELFKSIRRVVVKIGSSSITEHDRLCEEKMHHYAHEISAVVRDGREVVLVTSGAVSAGCGEMGHERRNLSVPQKQALAAVGQTLLMNAWRRCFMAEGLNVGQILLTEDDVTDRRRFINARHTMNELLSLGAVPVVNENDSVVIKEIRFGDNDTLSAHVVNIIEAELLIVFSDVDGFYHDLSDAAPVSEIHEITDDVRARARGAGSTHGTGGMSTKINAADILIQSGDIMVIARGSVPGVLKRIVSGEEIGTVFYNTDRTLSSRKKWIAFNAQSAGRVVIDSGAVRAICAEKKSLLASGIRSCSGNFHLGDAVDVVDTNGAVVAKGIVNYSTDELDLIKGHKTAEIKDILGFVFDEVINRDDLIVY